MSHPEHVARLLRPRSTWRDSSRGSADHEALDWQDACLALAGSSPLAFQAFELRHSENPPGRELVAHLLQVAEKVLSSNSTVTPETLVELLLREERAPEGHRIERHRCAAVGMTRGQWRHRMARPYSVVAAEIETLASDAWRAARDRVGEPVS